MASHATQTFLQLSDPRGGVDNHDRRNGLEFYRKINKRLITKFRHDLPVKHLKLADLVTTGTVFPHLRCDCCHLTGIPGIYLSADPLFADSMVTEKTWGHVLPAQASVVGCRKQFLRHMAAQGDYRATGGRGFQSGTAGREDKIELREQLFGVRLLLAGAQAGFLQSDAALSTCLIDLRQLAGLRTTVAVEQCRPQEIGRLTH